jgi:hypothetical protein
VTVLFALDSRGVPVLLAPAIEAPPEQQEKIEPPDRSIARRRDAVADAARTLDDLSPAGVEQLARQRWRGDRQITPEDFQSFSADARAQRIHDVVDALDFRVRRSVYGRSSGRQIHVALPKGIIGRSLASLEREDLIQVFTRLRDRGHSADSIYRHGVRRFDKDGKMREILNLK